MKVSESLFICLLIQIGDARFLIGKGMNIFVPTASSGIKCQISPQYGEYCDFGIVKRCSACSLVHLLSEDIFHPAECEVMPCPHRCPEELNSLTPAPEDSCTPSTQLQTPTQPQTTTTSTVVAGSTAPVTTGALAPEVHDVFTTTASGTRWPTTDSPRSEGSPLQTVVIILAVIAFIAFCSFSAFVVIKRVRKNSAHHRRIAAVTQPGAPLIEEIELPSSAPSSDPPTPFPAMEVIPEMNSLLVKSSVAGCRVSLACDCGGNRVLTVGADRTVIEDLLPGTHYKVVMVDEVASSEVASETVCTKGQLDLGECSLSLEQLQTMIEGGSVDYRHLRVLFSHITDTDTDILRHLSRTLGVVRLSSDTGMGFLDEIIGIDRGRNEESLKTLALVEALRLALKPGSAVPDYVEGICSVLHSCHPDCKPCKHMVHQMHDFSSGMRTTVV